MMSSSTRPWPPCRPGIASVVRAPASAALCQAILCCVAGEFALAPAELVARTRGPRIALARQTAMYLAHVAFALSFGEIARGFGRDRTTAAHACRRIEDRRDDAGFDRRLAALELRVRTALAEEARR